MTVEEIRAKFPAPVKYSDEARANNKRYCVLGAAILFNGDRNGPDYRFPFSHLAAEILGINWNSAWNIGQENDSGDFERAWSLLDKALKEKDNANRP